MKTLFIYVPDDLHRQFKIKAIRQGTTQKEIILSFLRLYVTEDENEKSKKTEPKKDGKKSSK